MSQSPERPFPWKCGFCGQRTIVREVFPYTCECSHDGETYTISIPDFAAPRCNNCGEGILDDLANLRVEQALRAAVGVLMPDQIRRNRETLKLTQEQLAVCLGVDTESVANWELRRCIQTRAMDRLLRIYFALPTVRNSLSDESAIRELGATMNVDILTGQPIG